jgi:hypothetical protein
MFDIQVAVKKPLGVCHFEKQLSRSDADTFCLSYLPICLYRFISDILGLIRPQKHFGYTVPPPTHALYIEFLAQSDTTPRNDRHHGDRLPQVG